MHQTAKEFNDLLNFDGCTYKLDGDTRAGSFIYQGDSDKTIKFVARAKNSMP